MPLPVRAPPPQDDDPAETDPAETRTAETRPAGTRPAETRPAYELIELFFFAYRDFVGDADRILAEYGFGRAHHRVLHFVSRRPGLRVSDLLEVLRITKQSLNRVLKELIDQGFIEQVAGKTDRRQRLLHATAIGADLAHDLALLQTRRIARSLEGRDGSDTGLDKAASRFLLGMIDPGDRTRVRRVISGLSVPD